MRATSDVSHEQRDAAVPPRWHLTDLISVETLQSIQDAFARAFALPTVIVDPSGVDATTITHRVPFCEDLTRTSPVAGSRCAGCDRSAMRKAADASRPAIFECWNGLYDCAIPIAPKGHVLGYFLCGQILTTAPDPALYVRTAAEIGVDPDEYVEALGDVKIVPYEQYKASVQSMHVLAGMIAEQAAASIDSLEMLEQARRAREDTAQLVEELDTILEALRDIGSQPDYQATLDSITDNLARLIPWDSCVIYLTDDDREELVPVVVRDPFPDQVLAYRPRKGRGILGTAALGGSGRRFVDVTREPDFEPIPGVPLEPESALVMPMIYKGTVSGVIILSRFERRTFTEHELRVLEVFSSQASVSIQVSKLASDNAQRLREERAFGRLRLAMGPRTKLESMLSETANAGLELLAADAAVVSASSPTTPTTTALAGIEQRAAGAQLRALAPVIERAIEYGEPEIAPYGPGSALVLPLAPGETSTFAVFSRRVTAPWDRRLAKSLSAQAALGIEKVRTHDRERQLLLEHVRLSELATELVTARDAAEVRNRLLVRSPEIFSADACFIALIDQGPDAIAVELRQGGRSQEQTIKLQGGARLAAVRLRDEAAPDRSVFDTWSKEVFASVGPGADLTTWLAEPMPAPNGALGGLFIAWRTPQVQHSPEQRRILRVLGGSAGTALSRFAVHMATDSTLRDRLLELEALTSLAQRISGLTRERPIADELLAALCRVARLDGAVYGASSEAGVEILRSTGLGADELDELVQTLEGAGSPPDGRRIPLGRDDAEVVTIPMPGTGERDVFLAGVGPGVEDDQRDRVLATLARYGSVALENAHLHDQQRKVISRLERQHDEAADQYTKLQRILSVHETLALAVLEGGGLVPVVRSLSDFMDAEMLAVDPQDRVLARWPADGTLDWRPEVHSGEQPRTVVTRVDEGSVVAAPAVLDGETLAWIIARMPSPAGEVDRAAVEYGALLTALELLRERTATEVETRLRGGLLEDLFSGTAVEDLVVKRAMALGYDLRRPSRVFLVEAAPGAPGDAAATHAPEAFYAPATECAGRWSTQNVVALRGPAVVILVPEAADQAVDGTTRRFEEELRATLSARLPEAPFNIAVGTGCELIDDHRESYLAARRGLDLLRLLGRSNGVFSFRTSSLESMLLQSTRPEVLVKFIARYVEPLERYDGAHTSKLRHTLEVYFEAGGKLEEAARRLHVHVSTLRYRLTRAADLLDVDLKDSSAALDVQVALKAAQVLRVHRV
jgi:ligand-binding sensor protein/sugar diacid utilization regulator/putative methionine-R-sulfoxide reductase with GAF domain